VRLLLALAVALALADASIVALALPPVLEELDASVEGVATVLGAYTLALALALPPSAALAPRIGPRALGAGGLLLLAAASLGCAAAQDLGLLVGARAGQAVGAAGALVAAFALLRAGEPGPGRRSWRAAALVGFAAGPALGGALTELFDWRAIFVAQAPLAVAAAVACLAARAPRGAAEAPPAREGRVASGPAIALGLLSAALTGVLFLLVLLLVAGWSLSPLAGAALVSVLPLAALAASRVPGAPRTRAAVGSLLVGGGVLALAFLPGDEALWTLPPQLLAGAGLGLALPALSGELLPERTPAQAARLLAARHLGITLALALLAPVAAAQLDAAEERTRERGVALLLDARVAPQPKLALAGELLADLGTVDPRPVLERRLAAGARRFPPEDRAAYAELCEEIDEALVTGINEAFRTAFLITGGLALLAAVALRPRPGAAVGLALLALLLPAGMAVARPEPVALADPCRPRELPGGGGLAGVLQDQVLIALDSAACRWGSTREALVIALADPDAARAYEREHGADLRPLQELLDPFLP